MRNLDRGNFRAVSLASVLVCLSMALLGVPLWGQIGGYGYGAGRYGYGSNAQGVQGGTRSNPYVPGGKSSGGQVPFPVGGGRGLGLPQIGGGAPVRLPGYGGRAGVQTPFPFVPSLGEKGAQGASKTRMKNLERWPSFVTIGGPGKVPFAEAKIRNPKQAVLFRAVDRVLVRPRGELAFYPLAFWDKKRVLTSGSEIRVLGSGRYLLLFSDGTRLDVLREGALSLDRIDTKGLELSIKVMGRASFKLGLRKLRVKLPDGTVLVAKNGAFRIDRIFRDGPGAEDRSHSFLRIRNAGASLEVQPSGGVLAPIQVRPFWQVLLPLLESEHKGLPLEQRLQGKEELLRADSWVRFRALQGGRLEARTVESKGRVRLGSVQFSIPTGQTLVLDPLLGTPFSGGRPVRATKPSKHPANKKRN